MASNSTSQGLEFLKKVQDSLDSTTPWIGMYVAAASAVCTLAMAADAFNGLRSKKYWLPCKYFSLNAFSLTLLAVAMKLPVDLTSLEKSSNDNLARISSLVLLSTAMSNFMTSLGAMENTEIVLNMAALGILVITIAGNVCIHFVQLRSFPNILFVLLRQQIASPSIMLFSLVMLCCMSLMVPGAERYIGLKYNEVHKSVLNRHVEWGRFSSDELENMVKGYWVMASTSSPQFVFARSAISSISGLLSVFTALYLVQAWIVNHIWSLNIDYASDNPATNGTSFPRGHPDKPTSGYPASATTGTPDMTRTPKIKLSRVEIPALVFVRSDYGWSVYCILIIQSLGVAMGTIAPLLRWFTASWFKFSETERKSFRDELKVENYWTWRLVEWRDRSLPFQVQNRLCKRLLRDALRFVLNLCIGIQILFVSASKLVVFLSATFCSVAFSCFCKNERPVKAQVEFRQHVLLLEGEPQLPSKVLNNICNEADKLIKVGEKRQPKNLIQLLKKSSNFNGVVQYDSKQVPSLYSQEPPNCWSLPVVTLTAISLALIDVSGENAKELLVSISQGLPIMELIEETLDRTRELESIRKAADVFWVGVETYKKWEEMDLKCTRVRGTTHKETLQKLSNIAKKIVTDFMPQTSDILMQNPLNWPARVIAANSMYRITQTILLGMGDGENQGGDELLESISITISDILAACFTNLVQVITLKCHREDIREREESVRRAAILLGESKEILQILQQRELPSLDVEKAAKIDEWRASMALDI